MSTSIRCFRVLLASLALMGLAASSGCFCPMAQEFWETGSVEAPKEKAAVIAGADEQPSDAKLAQDR